MNKIGCKKILFMKALPLVIILSVTSSISPAVAHNTHTSFPSMIIEFDQEFSAPVLEDDGQYSAVLVEGTNSFTTTPGESQLPVFTKTFEFPFGTTVTSIEVTPIEINTMSVLKNVKPVSPPQWLSEKNGVPERYFNHKTDKSTGRSQWYSYTAGSGINKNGAHVLHGALHLYPVQYIPAEHMLYYVEKIHVRITYTAAEGASDPFNPTTYDLVIITPEKFSRALQKLVDHKNNHGISTTLVTVEDIYTDSPGRDNAEQIKYFIKDALETWNVTYVLLVGSIDTLPIRTVTLFPEEPEYNLLSDLYYADIYDEQSEFCSWDTNGNDKFGEWEFDDVDLYPDVNLGRLACRNRFEVTTVVNKIINYEEKTYGKSWFNRLILCGGDTFPDEDDIYEGEITNDIIAQNMPGFTPIRLWASTNTFNAKAVNQEMNQGAGFVDYSGHGFEIGLGTHRPHNDSWLSYYTYHLFSLINRYKLPIVFFDACLTAKLDFNITELLAYLPQDIRDIVSKLPLQGSWLFPCFAWYCIKKPFGGVIATIGATREAYSYLDEFGAGYLAVHFFQAYEEGVTVSQMLTQSQNDYITYLGKDYFTLEEFLLLGDPSLRVGGYS